ncbi:hypothetical protein [Lactovum miscens]|uniref:Uncharacterized protein n=1 Tax=Lactovum miscens TaxID=190387 RepID=A0A841C7P5_9LACT|nr:hypothetical protein [Lactovum miscens]MBB5887758.1 hypothetical protein [Lactovum miscens]
MNDWTSKLQLIGLIFTVIGGTFGGFAIILRMLKGYILNDFNNTMEKLDMTMQELRNDLTESRIERKENDKKLFDISDVHTKEIYAIKGRVQTLEVVNHIGKGEKYD